MTITDKYIIFGCYLTNEQFIDIFKKHNPYNFSRADIDKFLCLDLDRSSYRGCLI